MGWSAHHPVGLIHYSPSRCYRGYTLSSSREIRGRIADHANKLISYFYGARAHLSASNFPGATNTPNTPHQCQAAHGTHVGVAFWRGASTRCGTGHTDRSQTSVDTAALPALSALAWS